MSKKKIGLIVVSVVVCVALACGVSFAIIWSDTANAKGNIGNATQDWNESLSGIKSTTYMDGATESVVITGYTGTVNILMIPSKIDGKPVTKIASSLANNSLVKEVVLPATIKVIDDNAFVNFTRLTKVTVTSAATFTIGAQSFTGCKALDTFGYTGSTITSIGANAFKGCPKLLTKPTV